MKSKVTKTVAIIIASAILFSIYNFTFPIDYDGVLVPYRKGKNWGFADTTKKVIVQCKYDKVFPFNGEYAIIEDNGFQGLIDKKGKFRIALAKYQKITVSEKGFILTMNSFNLFGLINQNFKEIVPCRYTSISGYEDNQSLAAVCTSNKWGLVNSKGKEFVGCKYAELTILPNYGLIKFSLNKKYGFLDTLGKEILAAKYDEIQFIKNKTYATAKIDGNCGLIDKSGKEIVECKYTEIVLFNDNLYKTKLDNKFGIVDSTGKEIVPCTFEQILKLEHHLIAVYQDQKYGLYAFDGTEIASCRYDWISDFKGAQFALVQRDGNEFYIDKNGVEFFEK